MTELSSMARLDSLPAGPRTFVQRQIGKGRLSLCRHSQPYARLTFYCTLLSLQ